MKFFLFLAAAGSLLGGLELFAGMVAAKSAPQEASAGAIACALAVVPYVFARACQLWDVLDSARERHAALLTAIHDLQSTVAKLQLQSTSTKLGATPSSNTQAAPGGTVVDHVVGS